MARTRTTTDEVVVTHENVVHLGSEARETGERRGEREGGGNYKNVHDPPVTGGELNGSLSSFFDLGRHVVRCQHQNTSTHKLYRVSARARLLSISRQDISIEEVDAGKTTAKKRFQQTNVNANVRTHSTVIY